MTQIIKLSAQAELALAAHANLTIGDGPESDLHFGHRLTWRLHG